MQNASHRNDVSVFLIYVKVTWLFAFLHAKLKAEKKEGLWKQGYNIMAKNLRLKAARAALDMTQKDLAEAIGISRQTMNAIEKGDYYPSVKLCIEICKVVGKTLDELFWED